MDGKTVQEAWDILNKSLATMPKFELLYKMIEYVGITILVGSLALPFVGMAVLQFIGLLCCCGFGGVLSVVASLVGIIYLKRALNFLELILQGKKDSFEQFVWINECLDEKSKLRDVENLINDDSLQS